jgi:diguanylate cyclase (GGDEF)-like protein
MEEVASKRVNKYRLSPEAKGLLERGAITSKTRLVAFDPLTKVYRDYVFQSVFLREAKRASRYKTNTSVVKVEVENWSSCRQRLGVEGCSLILRRLAEIIKGNLREVDFISRVGDSFIILLPNTGETGVKRVVQKLSTVISAFLEAGDLKVKPEVDIKSITYHPNDIKDIEYPKI